MGRHPQRTHRCCLPDGTRGTPQPSQHLFPTTKVPSWTRGTGDVHGTMVKSPSTDGSPGDGTSDPRVVGLTREQGCGSFLVGSGPAPKSAAHGSRHGLTRREWGGVGAMGLDTECRRGSGVEWGLGASCTLSNRG